MTKYVNIEDGPLYESWGDMEDDMGDMIKICAGCAYDVIAHDDRKVMCISCCDGNKYVSIVAQADNAGKKSNDLHTSDMQTGKAVNNEIDNYAYLGDVLDRALKQASGGKGHERHSCGEPFEEQLMVTIEKLNVGFSLGQAIKKIVESCRLEPEAATLERYGAINYIAGKIIETELEK